MKAMFWLVMASFIVAVGSRENRLLLSRIPAMALMKAEIRAIEGGLVTGATASTRAMPASLVAEEASPFPATLTLSEFERAFKRLVGKPPAAWRRERARRLHDASDQPWPLCVGI
jgi:hypothetical protein